MEGRKGEGPSGICDYDNACRGSRKLLGLPVHARRVGVGERVLGHIRKDKSCHSARTESQLNNSSRQLDWLRAIKLMMQGHWKWAQLTLRLQPPLAKINRNSTNK